MYKEVRELNISFENDIKAALQDEWTKISLDFKKKGNGINAQEARICEQNSKDDKQNIKNNFLLNLRLFVYFHLTHEISPA